MYMYVYIHKYTCGLKYRYKYKCDYIHTYKWTVVHAHTKFKKLSKLKRSFSVESQNNKKKPRFFTYYQAICKCLELKNVIRIDIFFKTEFFDA